MVAKWLIIAFMALGVVVTIASVGKERKPLTDADATAVTIVNLLIIAAMTIRWQA